MSIFENHFDVKSEVNLLRVPISDTFEYSSAISILYKMSKIKYRNYVTIENKRHKRACIRSTCLNYNLSKGASVNNLKDDGPYI